MIRTKHFLIASILIISPVIAKAMTDNEGVKLSLAAATGNTSDLKKLEANAVEGDDIAEYWLATYYDTKKNYVTAFHWCLKSAENGFQAAQYQVGHDYKYGLGVPQSNTKANYWFDHLAKQGNRYGEDSVGLSYFYGLGVPNNYQKAFYWFSKSTSRGSSYGECNLGLAYAKGLGVKQDIKKR